MVCSFSTRASPWQVLHGSMTTAGAAANRAGARNGEEALLESRCPRPPHCGQVAGPCRARRRSPALPAISMRLMVTVRLLAEDRLFELERQVVANVAAALCTRGRRAIAAHVEHLSEKVAEDVAQVRSRRESRQTAPPRRSNAAWP